MHRLLVIGATVLAGLVSTGTAGAWSWPADGAVLRPFAFGPDAYAAGQHRGIDVAGAEGYAVRAPASGTVTFAGSVPTNGRGVTILTASGHAVTLFHLGAIGVAKGDVVAEGSPVGAMGWSGEPEHAVPSVHLGVRIAAQAEGYVDPVGLLPARPAPTASPPPTPPPAPAPAPAPTPAASLPSASPPPPPTPAPQPGATQQAAPVTPPAETAPGTASGSTGQVPVPAGTAEPAAGRGAAGDRPTGAAGSPAGITIGAPGGGVVITAAPQRPPEGRRPQATAVPLRAGPGPARDVVSLAEAPAAGNRGRVGPPAVGRGRAAASLVSPLDGRHAPVRRSATPGRPLVVSELLTGTAGPFPDVSSRIAEVDVVASGSSGGSDGAWRVPLVVTALALAGVLAVAATRRGPRRIVDNGAVLHHHADLLRQRRPAHRARLHDRGGGRPCTPPAAARP